MKTICNKCIKNNERTRKYNKFSEAIIRPLIFTVLTCIIGSGFWLLMATAYKTDTVIENLIMTLLLTGMLLSTMTINGK